MDMFLWPNYLDFTQKKEVPHEFFKHVEDSLQNIIDIGMSLEVPIEKDNGSNDKKTAYWIATVVMVCGPLLRLCYFGSNDKSLEFWFNLTNKLGRELGWSIKNNERLEPPKAVLEKNPNCSDQLQKFLTEAKSLPIEALSGDGLSQIERIKVGMKVEVSDFCDPYKLWVATIHENVGGRLLLQYDSPGSVTTKFWLFCTSERIHPFGFVSKMNNPKWYLQPATSVIDLHLYSEWKDIIENNPKNHQTPNNLFNNTVEHPQHNFKLNMKLEAVLPSDRTKICPATVVKILDDVYFLVKIDTYNENPKQNDDDQKIAFNEKTTWLCTADNPYIFPVGWAKKHDINLLTPENWNSQSNEFSWNEYLVATSSIPADETLFSPKENASDAGLKCGMMLEVVDPNDENKICAAHISKIVENLLWIKFDCYIEERDEFIVDMHSHEIFPIGWCDSNHYVLNPPIDIDNTLIEFETIETTERKEKNPSPVNEHSIHWLDKIYFNHRCKTGPLISKRRLATLPKSVGPGPVVFILKEVVSKIVSIGYKSIRILNLIKADSETELDPDYQLESIKAKNDGQLYFYKVPIIRTNSKIKEFCRDICKKIRVCPNLFGPTLGDSEGCTDRCRAKSRKTGHKKGRKKGSASGGKQKPWGRRKKRTCKNVNVEKKDSEEFDQNESPSPPSGESTHQQTVNSDSDMLDKSYNTNKKFTKIHQDISSSNVSEDSRSSNDQKSKDSNDSPSSLLEGKVKLTKSISSVSAKTRKRRATEWDTSLETDNSGLGEQEDIKNQKKQRRPKTRKLESNPLHWSVDDVFRYINKTSDCKQLASKLRDEEVDGLAFLLLNYPSLIMHMHLNEAMAMKLCRHIEQVKATYYLRYLNEDEM